jgi:hypothetical protein
MSTAAAILAAMPGMRAELQRRTGLARATVARQVSERHAAGDCHIDRWADLGHGPFYPVYAAGPGPDAPLPPPRIAQDKSVIQKRWKDHAKTTGAWDQVKAQRRARTRKKQQQQQLWLAPLTTEPRPYY